MKPLPLCGFQALLLLGGAVWAHDRRESPGAVETVVQLLQELQARIESDGQEEQKAYDKFACWCEAITSKKAASITAVKAELQRLGSEILRLKGTVATTLAEIKQLMADIEENERKQQAATSIRQKERAAFLAEKVELEEALAALEKAIVVLRDSTQATSLLHSAAAAAPAGGATAALAHVRRTAARVAAGAQSPHATQLATLSTALEAAAAADGRYAPQSLTVQGILHDMYDTFASSLESRTATEGAADRHYESLMATWREELETMKGSMAKKEQVKTEAETMLAEAMQAFSDSEVQLEADMTFFDDAKVSCVAKTNEWSARSSLRAEELDGISQALAILTDDANREVFAKAIKPGTSLLQEDATPRQVPLARARGALQQHARQGHSIRLAALAAAMAAGGRLSDVGHFGDVLKAIDTLLTTLQQEEAEDAKKVADCKTQLQDVALHVQDLEWKLKNNDAQIDKLGKVVAAREAELGTALADLESLETDINATKDMRVQENADFLQSKADDEQAITLLKQARSLLTLYFTNHSIELGPTLLQKEDLSNLTDHAPEAKFSGAGKRKTESKGIISLLTVIIEDLESEIVNSINAEEAAQLDYEKRLAAMEAMAQKLQQKITDLREAIALRKQDLEAEEQLKTENTGELTSQEQARAALQPGCDWITQHQAERREKRATEAQGLRQARQYLAGAELPSMVQQPSQGARDGDGSFSQISFSLVSFLQRGL